MTVSIPYNYHTMFLQCTYILLPYHDNYRCTIAIQFLYNDHTIYTYIFAHTKKKLCMNTILCLYNLYNCKNIVQYSYEALFFGCATQVEIIWLLYRNHMAIVQVLFPYSSCRIIIQFVPMFHRPKKIHTNTILCTIIV